MYRTNRVCNTKHPDKICDRISDKILDFFHKIEIQKIETMGGHDYLC